ncbi:hypothetical protein [Lysobacter gummosus]|uniref:hypothetical protein n=1 Tax=Lysobacter gummosus TaxID=262324 RepID=UPI003640E95E
MTAGKDVWGWWVQSEPSTSSRRLVIPAKAEPAFAGATSKNSRSPGPPTLLPRHASASPRPVSPPLCVQSSR